MIKRTDESSGLTINPENLSLGDIIDIPSIQAIMNDFSELTGIGHAILDIRGNIITSSGWSEICAEFHRANEMSRKHCMESDLHLSKDLKKGEIRAYRCKNNLWDFVTPLYIGDTHVANVYTGQFFFEGESLDENIFLDQAEKYGFDKERYIAALRNVPRYSRERIEKALDFIVKFTEMISELSHMSMQSNQILEKQKNVEDELREAEKRYRGLYEGVPTGLYRTSSSGTLIEGNQALAKMFGYDDVESMKSIRIADHYADPNVRNEWMKRIEQDVTADDFITKFRRKDGTEFWAQATSRIVKDENDNVIHYEGSILDITQRMKALEEVRARDNLMKKISTNIPGMIYQFMKKADGSYCIPYSSDAIVDIFACSPEEVVEDASPIFNRVVEEDRKDLYDSIERSARYMTTWFHEYRVQIPGHSVKWMLGHATPERLPDGSVIWHGFNTDITERKDAEENLRESEERYRRLAENAPDLIYRIRHHPDIGVEFVSSASEKIMGYKPNEILEHPEIFIESIHPDDRHAVITQIEMTEDAPQTGSILIRFNHKDKRLVWCEARFIRIFDSSGKLVASEGVVRDVTDRILADQELQRRRELAEAATLKAQTYLDFIAHDLTNILSPMMIYAEMIANEGTHEPWVKSSATKIMRQIDRASAFVRNTRRLSESERKDPNEIGAIDVSEAIPRIVDDIRRKYPAKRIIVNSSMPDGESIMALGGEYVYQIIEEIMDNCAKHAKSDQLDIDVSITDARGLKNHEYWRLEISDNGPGIPDIMKSAMVADAFDPENRFSRGIASTLSFMSLISEHIGGRLHIQDRVKGDHTKGTTIVLMLQKTE